MTAAWLRTVYTDPSVNATFRTFFDTLPPLGSVLSPEMWPPHLIPELQASELVGTLRPILRYANVKAALHLAVYRLSAMMPREEGHTQNTHQGIKHIGDVVHAGDHHTTHLGSK